MIRGEERMVSSDAARTAGVMAIVLSQEDCTEE